jgi:UDP-glucose 4-epimerase
MNKNILITGGLGFIGRHLVTSLLDKGHNIIILDNLYHNQSPEDFKWIHSVNFIKGDIRDLETVNNATKNIDIIFHLAALSNVRESIENPDYCYSTNVTGTYNILNSAVKNNVKKVIFSSSREVYGNQSILPVKEEAKLIPINIYGATKACAEHLCEIFKRNYGLNISIFRISNTYGPGDPGKSRVIPTFIRKIKNNEEIIVNGGDQIIDFIWIDDVIKFLVDSLDKYSNEKINIGSGKGTSLNDLLDLLIKLMNKNPKIKYNHKILQEVDSYIADISKSGINPLELEQGLKKLLKI